jgi:hypothetical protein
MKHNHFYVKIITELLPLKNVVQNFGLLTYIVFKELPQVNHIIGGNSPNLAILP